MPIAQSQGAGIYWEESGAGEPLLLIMGLGATHDWWHRTAPVVSRSHRTILFDNRGVGQSDVPPGPYSIPQMAADAAAVLDAAGVASAHLYGMSMGGMIAQEFALQYPHRVRSLILGCTSCGGKNAVRAEQGAIDLLKSRGTETMDAAIEHSIPFVYDPGTPRQRLEEDIAIRRGTFPTDQAYHSQLLGILAWQSYDRLPDIHAPTLIIHGESDRLIPPDNARIIADRIPGARLVMIPHASHIMQTDQPETVHHAVLSFLAEHTEASSCAQPH